MMTTERHQVGCTLTINSQLIVANGNSSYDVDLISSFKESVSEFEAALVHMVRQ